MACRYCQRERACPFTVTARVADSEVTVEFAFCSRGCLAAWASPEIDYSTADVSGAPLREVDPGESSPRGRRGSPSAAPTD